MNLNSVVEKNSRKILLVSGCIITALSLYHLYSEIKNKRIINISGKMIEGYMRADAISNEMMRLQDERIRILERNNDILSGMLLGREIEKYRGNENKKIDVNAEYRRLQNL